MDYEGARRTRPQPVVQAGTGPQTAPGRAPVRGFPPVPPASSGPGQLFSGSAQLSPGPAQLSTVTAQQEADHPDGPAPQPPTSAPARPGHGRRRAARTTRSRRPSRRTVWLAAAAAVILALGGYVGYRLLYEPRVNAPVSSTLRLPTDVPASPGFDQALGKWQHIGTRSEDPEPLTLAELFPPQFELGGSSYARAAADVTKNCTLAVFGSNLQAALQAGHCTQVLRASYISGNRTMMGTIGVANLASSGDAQSAGRATGPQEIIAPLAAQKGPASKLGNGTGVVQAEIKGHYLILMWAEFANLESPSTPAQRQQLEQFAANLVTGSANIDLSTRMLTAKP